jgi:carbon storage regulator CsrA
MLVLSRKKNETVVLGPSDKERVEVTIIEIREDKVRLGLVVPKDWFCHRKEVWHALHGEDPPDE